MCGMLVFLWLVLGSVMYRHPVDEDTLRTRRIDLERIRSRDGYWAPPRDPSRSSSVVWAPERERGQDVPMAQPPSRPSDQAASNRSARGSQSQTQARGEQRYCRQCRSFACTIVAHRPWWEWRVRVYLPPAWTHFGPRWSGVYRYRQIVYLEVGRGRAVKKIRLDVETHFRMRVIYAGYDRIGVEILLLGLELDRDPGGRLRLDGLPPAFARTRAVLYRDGWVELERQFYLFGDPREGFELVSAPSGWGWRGPDFWQPGRDRVLVGRLDMRLGTIRFSADVHAWSVRTQVPIPLLPEDLFWAFGPQMAEWREWGEREGQAGWAYGLWFFSGDIDEDHSWLHLRPRQRGRALPEGQVRLSWDPERGDVVFLEGSWEGTMGDSLRLQRRVELRRIED